MPVLRQLLQGTPKKIPGRVGDSSLIGCGTYAENKVGGVSCTGWGESIIKVMLAREVAEKCVQVAMLKPQLSMESEC